MGDFTDFVCIGRIFSQSSLELEIFTRHITVLDFFSTLYVMSDIFLPGIYLHAFFLSKSVCTTFFSKITHKPLKSQMVGP